MIYARKVFLLYGALNKKKKGLWESEALVPLDYKNNPNPVVLAVDTSWKAVGFYIYQDNNITGQRQYARFGSITLNDREAHMSQPKRELFGLLQALEAASYWLLGARKLIVETDVKYLLCLPLASCECHLWGQHLSNGPPLIHATLLPCARGTSKYHGFECNFDNSDETCVPELGLNMCTIMLSHDSSTGHSLSNI